MIHLKIHVGLPQEVQAEGFAVAFTVSGSKYHWKSVDRPQKRQPGNLTELEDFCKEESVKIPQTRIERLLAAYRKRFTSCDTCQRGCY